MYLVSRGALLLFKLQQIGEQVANQSCVFDIWVIVELLYGKLSPFPPTSIRARLRAARRTVVAFCFLNLIHRWQRILAILDLTKEISLVSGLKWLVAEQHGVEHDASGPHIRRHTIVCLV